MLGQEAKEIDLDATSVNKSLAGTASPLSANSVEVAPPGFPLLRGIRWGTESATLLLHAPGGDLDDWRDVPILLVQRTGFGVVALDLPGHGLSDDPLPRQGDPRRLAELIQAVMTEVGPGPVRAAVAAEATARALLHAAPALSLAGLVCLSPSSPDPHSDPLPRSPQIPKLFLASSGTGDELPQTRKLAAEVGGWAVVSSVAARGPGAMLLDGPGGAQARDQITGFLRECLLRP